MTLAYLAIGAGLVLILPLVALCAWTLILSARIRRRRRRPCVTVTRIARSGQP